MNVLAIDTALEFLNLAIMKRGKPVCNYSLKAGATISRSIIVILEDLLARSGMKPADLELLVVTRGPGGFTGMRMGIAVAKTFGRVLDIPRIGVDTPRLLAAMTEPKEGREFFAALNCARHDVYYRPFQWRDGRIHPAGDIGLTTFERFLDIAGDCRVVFQGFDNIHTVKEPDIKKLRPMPLRSLHPDGMLLLREGLEIYRSDPTGPFDSIEPLYIKSEAFRK